jgi:hypothetical protein
MHCSAIQVTQAKASSMLHKCANPDCSRLFRRMTEGKLFVVETDSPLPLTGLGTKKQRARSPRRLEYRWLCDDCSTYLSIVAERGRGAITVPKLDTVNKKKVSIALPPATWAGRTSLGRTRR